MQRSEMRVASCAASREAAAGAPGDALERRELLLHETGRRDRLGQPVGRGEQEALDAELLLAGRLVARR